MMNNFDSNLNTIAQKITDADAVLVGAANGFSITEGLNLFASNDAFAQQFGDLQQQYGISCIIQAMGFPWRTETEKWAFWSRLINTHCVNYETSPLMEALKRVIGHLPFYIITSNGEHHFGKAGFEESRVFEVEGSFADMMCANKCCEDLRPTEEIASKITARLHERKSFEDLIPACPHCGAPMMPHYQDLNAIMHEQQWQRKNQEYRQFVQRSADKNLVILELGIGSSNRIIKAPFMDLAANLPKAFYATFNLGDICIPDHIANKAIGIDGMLGDTIPALAQRMGR